MLAILTLCVILCIILLITNGFVWISPPRSSLRPNHHKFQLHGGRLKMPPLNEEGENDRPTVPPSREDMETYAFILANITDCVDARPEQAISIMTKNLGWMLARNVPKYDFSFFQISS